MDKPTRENWTQNNAFEQLSNERYQWGLHVEIKQIAELCIHLSSRKQLQHLCGAAADLVKCTRWNHNAPLAHGTIKFPYRYLLINISAINKSLAIHALRKYDLRKTDNFFRIAGNCFLFFVSMDLTKTDWGRKRLTEILVIWILMEVFFSYKQIFCRKM